MIERLIDIAADQMKIDPAELRRRNTIPPEAMPYKAPLVFTYDVGQPRMVLTTTLPGTSPAPGPRKDPNPPLELPSRAAHAR
jgi:hypothetical protein